MTQLEPVCATCGLGYEAHAEHFGMTDGGISNCAQRLGYPVSTCQMCRGKCPPAHRYQKSKATRTGYPDGYRDGFHSVPLYPLPEGADPVHYKAGWADGAFARNFEYGHGYDEPASARTPDVVATSTTTAELRRVLLEHGQRGKVAVLAAAKVPLSHPDEAYFITPPPPPDWTQRVTVYPLPYFLTGIDLSAFDIGVIVQDAKRPLTPNEMLQARGRFDRLGTRVQAIYVYNLSENA